MDLKTCHGLNNRRYLSSNVFLTYSLPVISALVYPTLGNTSLSRENSSGMSSATSLGTMVSHTDWIKISCSGRDSAIDASSGTSLPRSIRFSCNLKQAPMLDCFFLYEINWWRRTSRVFCFLKKPRRFLNYQNFKLLDSAMRVI